MPSNPIFLATGINVVFCIASYLLVRNHSDTLLERLIDSIVEKERFLENDRKQQTELQSFCKQ